RYPSGILIAQALQGTLIIRPATLDLHPQMKHDLALEHIFHVETRGPADFLDATPLIPNDDLFLPIPFYQNQGMNVQDPSLLLERLNFHSHRIGQLITTLAHDLLSHQFCRQKALTAVSNLVFRKEVNSFWQESADDLLQSLHVVARLGR